jgi:predicted HTH domain antitoxin
MNALQIELPAEISVDEAQFLLTVKLFETGRLSLGQAARLAGYSKATYIEILSKQGVAVIDYPPEDLEREMNLWRRLKEIG